MTEWADVPGWGGLYQVTRDGRVRSSRRGGWREVRGWLGDRGYHKIDLASPGGERVRTGVHNLVALAFIGPVPDGQEVRHRNGIRLDNRAENLHYGTRRENLLDRVEHGTDNAGSRHGMSKLNEDQVRAIRTDPRSVADIADEYGVQQSTVYGIRSGRTWRHIL